MPKSDNVLKSDLIVETEAAIKTIQNFVKQSQNITNGDLLKPKDTAKAGANEGSKYGKAFARTATAILGAISFGTVINSFNSFVSAQRQSLQSNIALTGATKAVTNEIGRNNAVLSNSNSTYEQRASALGISTDQLYEEVDATKVYGSSINALQRSLTSQTRAFEDSLKPLESLITSKEREVRAINEKIDVQDREIGGVNQNIKSIDKETASINAQISSLKQQTEEKIKAFRNSLGAGELESQKRLLDIQKKQLLVKKDENKISGNFIRSALNGLEIKRTEALISINQNKLDLIDAQAEGLKTQNDQKISELQNQKDILETQKQTFENQKAGFEFTKQNLQDQADLLKNDIQKVQNEIADKKVTFELSTEGAKRQLEDLQEQASNIQVGGSKKQIKDSLKNFIDEQSKVQIPAPQFSTQDIQAKSKELLNKLSTSIGKDANGNQIDVSQYLNANSLNKTIGELLKSGITDLDQVETLLQRFIESAAGGKSEFIDLNQAIENLGFAFRTENSQIGNLSGIQENFTDIVKDGTDELINQAIAVGDLNKVQRLQDGILTDQEKTQAKVLGTYKVTNDTIGSFGNLVASGALESEKLKNTTKELEVNLGKGLTPVLNTVLSFLLPIVKGFSDFAAANPQLIATIGILILGLIGLVTVLSTAASIFSIVTTLATAFGVTIGAIVAPIGVVIAIIVGLTLAIFGLYTLWANNFLGIQDITKDVFNRIKDYVLSFKDNFFQRIGEIIGFFATLPIQLALLFGKAIGAIFDFASKIDWQGIWNGLADSFNKIDFGKLLRAGANNLGDFIRGLLKGIFANIPGADAILNPVLNSIPRFAKGGLVKGKNLLALLNDGGGNEFVVNAEGTKNFLPLLEAINSGTTDKIVEKNSTQNNYNYSSGYNPLTPSFRFRKV